VFYHANEQFSITNVCGLLKVKDNSQLSTRFMYYCLQICAKDYVRSGMGNPKLMSNVMATVTMGALGYKVFEPLISTAATVAEDSAVLSELYCRRSGANAFGRVTSEGFVVLKDSKLRVKPMSSYSDSARKMREKYANTIDAEGVLQRDILFQSPSGASCFVLMGSSNGYLDWCTEEGVPLKALNAGK